MRTGLTKQEKTTDIWFDEKDPLIHIRTHNQVSETVLVTFNTVSTSVKANKRVIAIISERSGFLSIRRSPRKSGHICEIV